MHRTRTISSHQAATGSQSIFLQGIQKMTRLWGAQITHRHPRGCWTSLCQLQLTSNQPLMPNHPPDLCPSCSNSAFSCNTSTHKHIKCCLCLSQVNYHAAQPSWCNTVSGGAGHGTLPDAKSNISLSPPAPWDFPISAWPICFTKIKIVYKGEHYLHLCVYTVNYTPHFMRSGKTFIPNKLNP